MNWPDSGFPPGYPWHGCEGCEPMFLYASVTVFKIAELDDRKNTLTLNVLLSMLWDDTRVTLETNKKNEQEKQINQFIFSNISQ